MKYDLFYYYYSSSTGGGNNLIRPFSNPIHQRENSRNKTCSISLTVIIPDVKNVEAIHTYSAKQN